LFSKSSVTLSITPNTSLLHPENVGKAGKEARFAGRLGGISVTGQELLALDDLPGQLLLPVGVDALRLGLDGFGQLRDLPVLFGSLPVFFFELFFK
jgi:hypothetical protein